MRHVAWMECDERTPEQIREDRLRMWKHEEELLLKRLETVRENIKANAKL